MKRFQHLVLLAITAVTVWLVQSSEMTASAQVIVYGNGGYGNGGYGNVQPGGSYNVYPQYPAGQYSSRQYSTPQFGYSRVAPQSRVTTYNRVAPQVYRGRRLATPSIQYNTNAGGYYYGGTPAYGNGFFYGNSGVSNMPGPPTANYGATTRGNFGQ